MAQHVLHPGQFSGPWYHGTVHDIEGDVVPGGAGHTYSASKKDRVYLTRNPHEAREWGEFGAEMGGHEDYSAVRVYQVAPSSRPQRVRKPEVKSDETPYDEWTSKSARVVGKWKS